jgi:tripartite-type tricarboxylate transporter receptor subunit TctC
MRAMQTVVTGLLAAALSLAAQAWPNRTVHLIVPFGTGSAPDLGARLYAERLALRWKQPVIVENRTGADGLVGVTAFAAARDDHTLLFSAAAPITVFPFTRENLAYDPARDFVPVARAIDTFGAIAVSSSLNVASLADLVRIARAEPGKLNSTGTGGAFPTLIAGFARTAHLNVVEIPYREQNLAIQDLAKGRIQIMATTLTSLLPLAQAGNVRILAVTNKGRAPIAPEVPTAVEAGHPELEFEGLLGFFGWRDMPTSLRDRISEDVRAVAAEPILAERLAAAGQVVHAGTPAEFAGAIEEQRARIEAIVNLIEARH